MTFVAVAVAYLFGAEVGHWLSAEPGHYATFWPNSGLYLALLLRTPPRRWWVVVAAAVTANLTSDVLLHGQRPAVALGFVLANTVEAVVGAVAVRWWVGGPVRLDGLRSVLVVFLTAAVVSTPLGGLIGAATVSAAFGASFPAAWQLWWVADALGVLLTVPLVLALMDVRGWPRPARLVEGAALLAGLVVAGVFVFTATPPVAPIVLLLFLLWAAIRLDLPGVAVATFALAVVAVRYTVLGHGIFAGAGGVPQRLVSVQLFVAVPALVFYAFAVVLAERRRAEAGLEERVRERTAALLAQRELLSVTLTSIGDGVITTDVNGHVTNLNAVAETLTGWTTAEASGQSLDAVFKIVNETTRQPVENPAVRALKQGVIVGLANHTVLIARDGTERPIDDSAAPIRSRSGEVVGCVLVFRDITNRKQADRLAQEQASLIQAVNDNTADLIFMKDRASRLTYANAATLRMIGTSREEAVRASEAVRFHDPDDIAAIAALDRRVLDTGETVVGEEPYTCADGRKRVFLSTKSPLRGEAGQVVGVIGVSRDITEQKEAAEQLRARTAQLNFALASTGVGMWLNTLPFDRLEWDDRTRALFHVPPGVEPTVELFWSRLHPDDREPTRQAVEAALRDGTLYAIDHRVVNPDTGAVRWVRSAGRATYNEGGVATRFDGINYDITDQKRAEDELRRRETFIGGILGSITDAFLAVDKDWRLTFVNGEIVRRFGKRREEIVGGHVWEMFPDAVGNEAHSQMHRAMADRVAVEYEVFHPPWQRWFLDKVFPTADGGLAVYSRDITERKQAGEEIRRLNQELRGRVDELQTLLDILPVGVWQADKDCERIVGNAAAYEMLGMERGVNASLTATSDRFTAAKCVVGGRELGPNELPLQRVARTGVPVKNFEHDVVFADGRVVTALCNAAPLLDRGGGVRGVVGMYADITDRKRAEALQAGQAGVLEMVAAGRPLADVLAATCRLVEEQEPGLTCSVLLPDEQGRHTGLAVGASLPDSYLRGLEGLRIDPPYIGSCGETLNRGEPAVVPDVQTDGRFAPAWRGLLTAHGLRACRSVPVFGADGTVLASFAVYRREPGDPGPCNAAVADLATHLAGIAIGRRRAEDRLRQSEGRFRLMADAMPQIVYVTGPDGRVEFVNRQWQTYTGQPDAQTADLAPLIHPDDLPDMLRRWDEAKAGGTPFTAEFRLRRAADGEYRWFLTRAVPVRDDEGCVERWFGTSTDIHDMKRAAEQLRYQSALTRTITDNATTAIFMMDARSRCTFMNPAAERMTGFTFQEAEGGVLHDLIHHHRPDGSPYPMPECPIDRALPEQFDVAGHEDVFIRKGGEFFPVLVNAKPIRKDGAAVATVIEVRDVTAERRAADENARLIERLRETDRQKDEFLATLAHELRNPLAPIRNGIQIMKLAGGNADAVERSRGMIERQVEQMARLIDDLMDLSRISRGKIALQKTRMRLAEAIRDAVDTSRPLIERQGHELVLAVPDEPIFVDGDGTRLTQVFANLLNNAAKYTDPGGRIRLAVEQHGGEVVVSVEDNGVGIPADMLPRVFDMFAQVDRSLEKSQGGLGIGLNIVKKLVDMHGGAVGVVSAGHGRGSTFTVRLPVVLSLAAVTTEEEKMEKVAPARRRILVVDDNKDGATSLAEMLDIMGNETQTAFDGLEAVAVAGAFRPDVILMDIGMPKLNGFEACRRIRGEPWGRNVVIVAQTGWGQEDDKRKSQEAGFDFHMVKPVDPAALEKMLAGMKATTG